jgi:iron complex outermembrane receptor protein
MKHRRWCEGTGLTIASALLSMALMTLPCAAIAQLEEPETGPDASDNLLEEVIVTARRRPENLMRVPMAVSAFTGGELEQQGALDITYLTQNVPNTTVEVARGTNNSLAAYIRGVGQQDHIAGFESGVGLYVDDVYLNRPQAAVLDIYDIERIEVLRGPQGTLYGRNTVGGAIKYVTRRLDDEAGMRLRGRVGNYGLLDGVLSASLPLGETFRIGATAAAFNLDGFGENLYLRGVKNYDKDVKAARLSAEWTPDPSWFVRFSADWLQDDSDLRRGHRLMVGGYSGAPVLKNVFDTRAGNTAPEADVDASGAALLVEWAASTTVKYRFILASRKDETWKPVDLDSLPSVDADTSTLDRNRQTTAELQAVFDSNRWSGVAGLFFIDANAVTVLDTVLGVIGDLINRPGLSNQLQADVDTLSWAVFADATWRFSDAWAASIGGRFTYDDRSSVILRETLVGGLSEIFGGNAELVATTSDFDGSAAFRRFTPRLALHWQPADDQDVYLSYARGFKGGGFDPRGLTSLTPDFDGNGTIAPAEVKAFMRFEPEEAASWETGWKATLLGGRMNSRLALFLADYSDVQIPGAVAIDENGDGFNIQYIGKTTNAAAADMKGVEWEGLAIVAEDLGLAGSQLRLSWALGYIDARFSRFIDDSGQNAVDQRVFANTPPWTAAVTASYEVPVAWLERQGRLNLTSSLSWRDKQYQADLPHEEFDQPAYTLWDLGITWSRQDGRWQLGLQGRNLTNEVYKVSGLDITIGLEGNYVAYYGNPRQYWLDFQYFFQ